MTDTTPTAALTVLFRPGRGRWKRVGVAASYREALKFVTQAGDWWFRRSRTAAEGDDAAPDLFDDAEAV